MSKDGMVNGRGWEWWKRDRKHEKYLYYNNKK